MEPLQVQALGQLQDVHAPAGEMSHKQGQSGQRRRETDADHRKEKRLLGECCWSQQGIPVFCWGRVM